ncbi:hypothetical protein [Paenibacillus crassostreae]|uniref:Uncharacterized protein n=1 Tax=Paenibacillus crassostreae TaxID=1763538 RepID=A0A167C6K1_9BACL|nr:hypothetical protein [Paenibacillus crassostreae]AOZ91585.1 hypothetical protein LPB68_04720 [Paenibacillus crassostreae]OAB72841.1 hypothetical protein PNBC_15530 [Paenibacillus crassostreae]
MNNNQAILDVLNSLEVIEQYGGDDAYILVENSIETRAKLNTVGVTDEQILGVGDEEQFCILALACNEGFATDYQDGKLVFIESKEITCKLLDGSEVILSEGDRVLAVRTTTGNGLPITVDADKIIDAVLITLAETQEDLKCLLEGLTDAKRGYGYKWKERALRARKERDYFRSKYLEEVES